VYVDCFTRDSVEHDPRPEFRESWKDAPVVVCDGGDQFFGVEYNVESDSFVHYAANGPYSPR